MPRRYALLFIGVFASSTAVIMIRLSHTHPAVLGALRLLLAAALLAPLYWNARRKHQAVYTREHRARTLLPAALLAVHFISWGYGSRLTPVASASLIANLVPIALPFFLHYLVGERINRTEVIGTALALSGVVALTAPGLRAGSAGFWGNVICFGSMIAAAGYVALGRRNRDFPSLWLYVVPVYLQAGLICLVVSLPWLGGFDISSGREWLLMLGLAVLPTILGHSMINYGVRHLRGQVVSLCNVTQFVFAGILGYLIFHEQPSPLFYAASTLVVAGIALVVFSSPTQLPAAVD
jgi:drug/metabolite transporter (DMT)-like permease